MEWTQELHERFVNAVETLGADKAVPSKILEHMGPMAAGLTRQNVASHLQKYRTRKRTQNDFCKAAPYCPPAAYHCWSPFSPHCPMIGAPLRPVYSPPHSTSAACTKISAFQDSLNEVRRQACILWVSRLLVWPGRLAFTLLGSSQSCASRRIRDLHILLEQCYAAAGLHVFCYLLHAIDC